eukprot:XP_011664790.1 PREDICTED: oncoprotein-induced transcript 3 protein [Strongylocentrotus purpuratus]
MAKFHFLVVCSLFAVLFQSSIGLAADPCDQSPCLNRGTCTSGTNSTSYQCICLDGYNGTNCEVDPCVAAPCLNGGTCHIKTSGDLGPICHCKRNFLGKNCEKDAYACRSLPCMNGGECRNRPATGSYMCRCLPGSSGEQCENNVDDCASSPCQNGATCTDLVGGFVCTCPKGIVGQLCEMDFSSEIEVSCDATEMTITLVRSLLVDGDNASSIHLNEDTCTGVFQDDYKIMLSTPYGECGTTVEEAGDTIIFSNTIIYTKNLITTQYLLQLPVQCILGKKEIVDGSSGYGITRQNATAIKGYAQFELMLERYNNETFDALPSSGNVRIRDELFYAVSLESSASLTVLLDECWATPSPDANDTLRYNLLVDGCPVDNSLNIFTNLGPLKQGFSFQAFAFVGGYPQVHVHCAVTMCVTNGSGCQQGCTASPLRLRRSLRDAESLMTNTISSEPITLN